MNNLPADEFVKGLQPNSRLLGLDIGTKTIGVAVGSIQGGFASPLEVIKRSKISRDAQSLNKIIADYGVIGLVVGWPLNVDGTESKRCQATKDIMIEIMKYTPSLPITFHDERFSTKKADTFMIDDVDLSRIRRSEIVDKMAAQIILQDFLDSIPR
jgi:putative Holliday junction resolvase